MILELRQPKKRSTTISPYQAFILYKKVYSHLYTKSYDLTEGKGYKFPVDKFEQRYDYRAFEKLSQRYIIRDLYRLYLANLLLNRSYPTLSLPDHESWIRANKYYGFIRGFENQFIDVLEKFDCDLKSLVVCKDGNHSIIFRLVMGSHVPLEIFMVLAEIFNLFPHYDRWLKNDPVWDVWSLKLKKYARLLVIDGNRAKDAIRFSSVRVG